MPTYIVETFLPTGAAAGRLVQERMARSAADALTRAGTRVTFEGSIHVPDDEICLFRFEAPSRADAAHAAQQAGLEPLRVVEAVLSPEAVPNPVAEFVSDASGTKWSKEDR